jgi:methylglutaconyl-CoA hydratase
MIREITEAFKQAGKEKNARYVFLSGAGKSFCAGADLEWMRSMKDYSLEQNRKDSEDLFEMFQAGYELDLPIVGKVHGHVMGGAVGLVSLCDIVAAELQTLFCFSEVKWGLVPAVISPFVTRKMKKSKADQFMLSAKVFSSEEALDAGLVHFVGDEPHLNKFLKDQCELLSQAGPVALRETKKLLKKIEGFDVFQFKQATTQVIAERRVSEEGQKGLQFFVDKVQPHWKNS